MAKIKTFFKWLIDALDDVLAYVLTVVGIMASTYLPMLKTGEPINVDIGVWKIALSAIVALMIVGKGEHLETDESGDKAKSKAGRKKRFWTRMSNALAQGVMWSQIMNMAS